MITPPTPPDIEAFAADLDDGSLAANTVRNYTADLRHLAQWYSQTYGEPFSAESLTPSVIRGYVSYLRTSKGARPATVNRRLSAIRRFSRWAVEREKLPTAASPVAGISSIKQGRHGPKGLSQDEYRRLLHAAERFGTERDVAIIELLRHTGIRVGELVALRLGDVMVRDRSGILTVRDGKGGVFNEIPLNSQARRALRPYIEEERRVVANDSADRRAPLFLGTRGAGKGTALTPRAVQKLIAKYAYHAKLVGATPHRLRHTFSRRFLDESGDLVMLNRLLGHRRLETTAIYTQPTLEEMAEALERSGEG